MMTNHSKPYRLNHEEVISWIKAYQRNPSEDIKTKLVLHYEDLVRSLSRKFSRGGELNEDLVQVGMIGLFGALTRFDFDHGKSFESFAVPTIIGEIKRYLRDKTWSVHVPRRIKELAPKIKNAVEHLTTRLQRSPSIPEIAQYIGVTEEEILEASEMSRSYKALSVDHEVDTDQDGGTVTLLDLIGQRDEGYERVDYRLLLDKILHILSEKEQQVIKLTYMFGLSQKEAGEKLGISQMHVSRLQRRAIQKMRELIRESDLLQQS